MMVWTYKEDKRKEMDEPNMQDVYGWAVESVRP